MIVTCPACSVRYLVELDPLAAKGRIVRCARCAHTWRLETGEDAPVADAEPEAPELAATVDEPPQPEPPHERERAPAPRPDERLAPSMAARSTGRRGRSAVRLAVVVAVLAVLGWAAVVQRNVVASLLPGTAPLYALAGIPVGGNSPGLVFRNVTTSRDMANGLPTLVIKGEVANVSSVARAVPPIVAILRDSNEHDLSRQSFSVPAARLLPGESTPFQTTIPQPAAAATGVVVVFAGSGG